MTDDSNNLAALIGRATANFELADYETAVIDLDAAIARDPQNAELINIRAETHLQLDDLDAAVRDAERALNLDSNLAYPYFVLGMNQMEQGNAFQAVVELTDAVELDPEFARAFAARGRAQMMLDDPDRARADANRAIELDPELGNGYIVRAYVHAYELTLIVAYLATFDPNANPTEFANDLNATVFAATDAFVRTDSNPIYLLVQVFAIQGQDVVLLGSRGVHHTDSVDWWNGHMGDGAYIGKWFTP